MSLYFKFHNQQHQGLVFGGLMFFLFMAGGPLAEELTEEATYSWQAPTYGTTPVHYVMELEKSLGDDTVSVETFKQIQGTSYRVLLEYGFKYRCRVAAVDARDVQGPWSPWSDIHAPDTNAAEHLGD